MPEYGKLLEAASFAARAHRSQFRKDGATPYVSHPFRVCLIVRDMFGFDDPRLLITALLHDTIEDTTTDFDDVAERFGPEVAGWVSLLSKDKRLADAEREREYLRRLTSAPWQVQVCKLADVFDNLVDSVNLPADRRQHNRARAHAYFSALEAGQCPEAQPALRHVRDLLAATRDQDGSAGPPGFG